MTSTIEDSMLEKVTQLREQLSGVEPSNMYNAFRAQLKQNDIRVGATRAAELYKAAGQAIQRKSAAAASAAPTNGPSAETQDGQELQEPQEQEEVDPNGGEEEDDAPEDQPPPLMPEEEEEFYSLADIKENHLFPYDDSETFAEFEERVAQGCAYSRSEEREAVEAYAVELLGDAVAYLQCRSQGLHPSQIKLQLKRMQLANKETAVGLANRYCSLARAFLRLSGPGSLDDSLKTKARTLIANAGLPANSLFTGPDMSMSTDSPRGDVFATPDGRGPPRSPTKAFNIGTPASPYADRSPPRSPGGYQDAEDWEVRSNAGSQTEQALLTMLKVQSELLERERECRPTRASEARDGTAERIPKAGVRAA